MERLVAGNEITLLHGGLEYFPALIEAIEAAQRVIYLETYIYYDDVTGERVSQALADAARRGVTVRVTVDGFGSRLLSPRIQACFSEAGVELAVFRPEHNRWHLSRRRLRRMHRKLVVIDEECGFVGGINILDDLVDPNHGILDAPRFDFAVRVRGPLLSQMVTSVMGQWLRVGWPDASSAADFARLLLEYTRRVWSGPPVARPMRAAFIVRDNLRSRYSIEAAYLLAITRARRSITISNAYFLPGRRFRRALMRATGRGVQVRLLLQGRSEYWMQRHATQALYDDLLQTGVEIHEYQRSFLHAKVAVVDDQWATVGSSNIDPFSLLLAREANIVVRDRDFALQLGAALDAAIETDAQPVALLRHTQRPRVVRMLNWVAYGLLRFAVFLTGRAARY